MAKKHTGSSAQVSKNRVMDSAPRETLLFKNNATISTPKKDEKNTMVTNISNKNVPPKSNK